MQPEHGGDANGVQFVAQEGGRDEQNRYRCQLFYILDI
jgi:hypothetical protein